MIDVTFAHVSKRYRIRRSEEEKRSVVARLLRGRGGQDFWAIRDVAFEVAHAETLGIIGHNGAGKSTILKLLSRITAPTSGEIVLNGRLAALIEVGSGFHPELSGRENVYLSGSILGMRRREIQEKFDRIVDFSGVRGFIDTPVKWYSSGMYVRLGFAIAAHMDPDILLVDEVLAVGDAAFQRQCLERLNELRRGGTTMLFISHDLSSIERLCDRVILMDHGRIAAQGTPGDVVTAYLRSVSSQDVAAQADVLPGGTAAVARVSGIQFVGPDGADTVSAHTGAPFSARVTCEVEQAIEQAVVELFYYSRDGQVLLCQFSTATHGGTLSLAPGRTTIEFTTPELGLQPGVYSAGATIRDRTRPETIDWFYGRALLYIERGPQLRGYFYAPHEWREIHGDDRADAMRSPA